MPVDNDLIKTKIEALAQKEQEVRKQIGAIRTVIGQLRSIEERDIAQRDPNDSTKTIIVKHMDNDTGTGQPFTTVRRQEVFDASIAEADRLLA